jgi:hypothetical protein
LLEIATKEIRMRGGVILKHFSARDVVSRWDVLEVHRRSTSMAAARFLDTLLDRVPFPVKALQVDGGGEFAAAFEQACQQKELLLFVLPSSDRIAPTTRVLSGASRVRPSPVLNFQLRHWEKNLQLHPPPVPRLSNAPSNLSAVGNSNSERQSVTNLLDEYSGLTLFVVTS